MVKVALCDDNPQVISYYCNIIGHSAAEVGVDVKIIPYESGEQLLFMLSDSPNAVDIIYLDILMGKMNGIETAKRLREIGCMAAIIFLTTSDEYVFEAFDTSPFYYIVKDEMPLNKFKEIFRRAVSTIKLKENDYVSIAYGGTTVKLELSKITYFEVLNRLITVHTADSSIEYYEKMENVEKALEGKGFVRIHRSYLVNCYYIHKLTRTAVCLADGSELPVSAKYSHSVQQQFSKYLLSI